MKQIETKAKTVHEAIEDAVTQLGVAQEDLDIEILDQGGLFKKAHIRATVKAGAEIKPEPKQEKAPEPEVKPETKTDKLKPTDKKETKTQRVVPVKSTPIVTEGNSPKFVKTQAFVVKLLETLGNDSAVTTEHTDNAFNINVNGENIGQLIGKNGMVLNAIQTLVSSIAISNSQGEGKRVFLNIGDYRERRGDTVTALAKKKADYVKSSGRQVKLDPMNARERAIVHSALADVEGIKTYSTGKDPFRCLVIAPADQ